MPPPEQRRPFPDKAHEDLATWVEEAIADLGTNRADVDDSFSLLDVAFELLSDALTDIVTGSTERGHLQQRIVTLEGQVETLTAAVAELQAASPPPI